MDQAPGRDQPDRCNVALKVNKQKCMSSYVIVGKRKGRSDLGMQDGCSLCDLPG